MEKQLRQLITEAVGAYVAARKHAHSIPFSDWSGIAASVDVVRLAARRDGLLDVWNTVTGKPWPWSTGDEPNETEHLTKSDLLEGCIEAARIHLSSLITARDQTKVELVARIHSRDIARIESDIAKWTAELETM